MTAATAIVQARMGSTRLPGKVLMDLAGQPVLQWVVERVRAARSVSQVVVATTVAERDDPIEQLCQARDWDLFRGSEIDVLDRYYRASREFPNPVMVRVTADCPLIDPGLIDRVVSALAEAPMADYASNVLEPRTYPRGLDVEAFSPDALAAAWQDDQSPWREHVTPFLYRNPDRFRLRGVWNHWDASRFRWTVDTPEDLTAVRALVDCVQNTRAGWEEYVAAVERHPELRALNSGVVQKAVE